MKAVLVLVFLLLIPAAAAKYITMATTVSGGTLYGGEGEFRVFVEQKGDESAYKAEAVPEPSAYFEYSGKMEADRLSPGESMYGFFNFSSKGSLAEGLYPLVIRTTYHDANGHPFSVVAGYFTKNVADYGTGVSGSMGTAEVPQSGTGEAKLKIKNLEGDSKEVKVMVYLPDEIKVDDSEKTVALGPFEEREIKYVMEPQNALVGSTYSVLASLEYDSGKHHASYARGTVRILEAKEGFGVIWILATLFIALLSIFIYLKRSEKK